MIATVRRAAVAGSWYPGTAAGIAEEVDRYLEAAGSAALSGRLVSWVSPKQTILLFTASGSAARQLAPKVLAALLRESKAKVLETSDALMDRVVNAIVGPEGDALPVAA